MTACSTCEATDEPQDFATHMVVVRNAWDAGYHQEQCSECRRYTLWAPGAPDGMWAIGAMKGKRPYPVHGAPNEEQRRQYLLGQL